MSDNIAVRPLRRSMLYVPAHDDRAVLMAKAAPADVICLDLEDGVPPAQKARARARAGGFVTDRAFGDRELIVRINSATDSNHAEDIAMCVATAPDGVVVPKVSRVDQLTNIIDALGPTRSLLWCMIETAAGLLETAAIARASDRVTALLIGGFDLAENLGLAFGSGMGSDLWKFTTPVVVAARAAGICAIDAISLATEVNELGFDGRACAPGQDIEAINMLFTPKPAEIERAKEGLDGTHAYGDHIIAARRLLDRVEQIAVRRAALLRG